MTRSLLAYGALAAAILCEVTGSALLQKSQQFTRPLPTLGMTLFYVASFYLLSQALKEMPLGVAYAIWAGGGIILTTMITVVVFHQKLDAAALVGIALIVCGVVVMRAFSTTSAS
jgi:small multidrug resistance pump